VSDDEGPSRRALLRGLAGVSALGTLAGVGTNALVTERVATTGNSIRSRSFDLELAYRTSSGKIHPSQKRAAFPDSFADGNRLSVSLDDLSWKRSPSLTIALRRRPCTGQLWMRVVGDRLDSKLARAVEATVVRHEECGGPSGFEWDGSLASVDRGSTSGRDDGAPSDGLSELQTGILLRNDCPRQSASGCASPTCVSVELSLPTEESMPEISGDQTVRLAFEFVARQCNDQQHEETNPWNQ